MIAGSSRSTATTPSGQGRRSPPPKRLLEVVAQQRRRAAAAGPATTTTVVANSVRSSAATHERRAVLPAARGLAAARPRPVTISRTAGTMPERALLQLARATGRNARRADGGRARPRPRSRSRAPSRSPCAARSMPSATRARARVSRLRMLRSMRRRRISRRTFWRGRPVALALRLLVGAPTAPRSCCPRAARLARTSITLSCGGVRRAARGGAAGPGGRRRARLHAPPAACATRRPSAARRGRPSRTRSSSGVRRPSRLLVQHVEQRDDRPRAAQVRRRALLVLAGHPEQQAAPAWRARRSGPRSRRERRRAGVSSAASPGGAGGSGARARPSAAGARTRFGGSSAGRRPRLAPGPRP